ncbi:MAG: hypothetical protein KGZ25_11330, partial [Planctomycetes bacterium]|nr:hypothetical protein [Planctomycetota bacterium]
GDDALRYQPAGRGGSCLRFAHSIYHIAYQYYRSRLFDSSKPRNKLVGKILKRLVGKDMHEEKSFKDRLLSLMGKITYSVKHNRASGVERDIMEQLQRFWERSTEEPPAGPNAVPSCGQDEKTFEKACRISQEFAWIFVRSCIAHGRQGEILKTVQTLAALGPVALGIAPYLAAFRSLHKGKALERKVVSRFGLARASDKGPKRALLTERCAAEDFALGLFAPDSVSATTIISCVNGVGKKQKPVVNFEPVGALDFRTRGNERIVFPPFLEIIEFLEKKEFKEIVVTDPGLLGLTGLLASRLLGIRAVGVYREKSVQRVMAATGDETLERLANQYLAFFYGQMDMVFVSSEGQRKNLSGAGFNPQKLRVIHCGSSHDESAEQPTCGARAAVG